MTGKRWPCIGRRGSCLLIVGVADFFHAGYMATLRQPGRVYQWYASLIPLNVWAAMWALTGMACVIYAFRRHDRIGYDAAIGIKVIWLFTSLAGILFDGVPLIWAVVWVALAALVWVISGWPECDHRREDQP